MSKTIYNSKAFSLTEFFDGKKVAIQITTKDNKDLSYLRFNQSQICQLIYQLKRWLDGIE